MSTKRALINCFLAEGHPGLCLPLQGVWRGRLRIPHSVLWHVRTRTGDVFISSQASPFDSVRDANTALYSFFFRGKKINNNNLNSLYLSLRNEKPDTLDVASGRMPQAEIRVLTCFLAPQPQMCYIFELRFFLPNWQVHKHVTSRKRTTQNINILFSLSASWGRSRWSRSTSEGQITS